LTAVLRNKRLIGALGQNRSEKVTEIAQAGIILGKSNSGYRQNKDNCTLMVLFLLEVPY
jgi:hypothetical protein